MLTVRVPATIANLGPGFDSFGMAVTLYNTFHFKPAERDALSFSVEGAADVRGLSVDPDQNILFGAMERLAAKVGLQRPFVQVEVVTDIPVARGLGSSSTAIVAGLVAMNRLLGDPLNKQELLTLAVEMEGHPDNVAPALLGGVVLYDTKPYLLPWPLDWRVLTLSPDYPVLTEEARKILPKEQPMDAAIFNLRKASVLTYALLRQDPDALREALHDRLHQPYRKHLIKEYEPIERNVMDAGAYGMIISGSGSTMAVFYPTVLHGSLLDQMDTLIRQEGWRIQMNDLSVDTEGAYGGLSVSGALHSK
jgi:homoserine kinase